ncbi:NAD(P)-binding protein [Hypoxylon sp. FL1857]|nr:NAD(P)-binding protein [Hypoxylon sp. FL1857]
MEKITVAIVGASGETGQSIVNGLLSSPNTEFDVTALTRPESLNKPINAKLQERGVKVVPVDLNGPQDKLVDLLTSIDVVISAIFFKSLADEIPLANAAKAAGVKRFVQSAFMIVVPPRGVVDFRAQKEDNLNYFQMLRLPYTYIDAGWWYQLSLPRLPSGRFDDVLPPGSLSDFPIGLDGNVPSALADIRDVGRYVARIIADPRTLNKRVHVYNEVYTQNQIYNTVEKLTGETLPRTYISQEEVVSRIDNARRELNSDPTNSSAFGMVTPNQLFYSWGIRGDNAPEYASYLGYLSGKDLYPDFQFIKFEDYVKEVLDGETKGVYQDKK